MADWEFLIQREGDRGWRPIETGNLQLKEGKYRIVANSQLLNTQIQTRITHQTLGLAVPKRRSRSSTQASNARGLVVIIPFTHLQSGIWQFVCSGTNSTQVAWHRILKLRVLPRTPIQPTIPTAILDNATVASSQPIEQTEDISPPTAPIVPISMLGEQENWADGLERLLAQIERDSLHTPVQHPTTRDRLPGVIQLNTIFSPPSQPISLNRSTFSGIIPGNRLTIAGGCNLQLLKANLVQTKVEKLSICLRHPQTSEIIVSIEQSLPPNLDVFGFRGQLDLPAEPKIGLLLGEVNLYDKHHIQLGSSSFTITLNLNPLRESELSLLQLFDGDNAPTATLAQLTQELKIEALTTATNGASPDPARSTPSTIQPLKSPPVPLAYKPVSSFTHPDLIPVEPSSTSHIFDREAIKETTSPRFQSQSSQPIPPAISEITDDLEIGFSYHALNLSPDARNYPNLEIVIDD